MESPLPTTTFNTSSTNDGMKPNTTNTTQVLCEVPAHPVFIFAYSLVFLVSLVLNCITMRVYFCTNQHIQSSIMVYMKNLAASDFFICLCLPLHIAYLASSSKIIRNINCSFGGAAFYINMYASIFFMDLIAVNRYLKIVRPLETHALQTVRTARYISAATWIGLLTPSSIYCILFLKNSWGQMPDEFTCTYQELQLSLTYKIIHCGTIVVFIFILVSLILLYLKTLQKLRQVQISTQTTFSNQTIRKSKRNMQVLIVIFCVCFVPYHLVKLPLIFIKPLLHECLAVQAFYILKEMTILLAALNASLDPLIYFLFCRTFRAQFNVWSCLLNEG